MTLTKVDKMESLDYLRKLAVEFGALEAKIISVKKIVIEVIISSSKVILDFL